VISVCPVARICCIDAVDSPADTGSSEPDPPADGARRSPIMGKGNKPQKKEVKKPKKDKKAAKK
jgi:hypothetical protein